MITVDRLDTHIKALQLVRKLVPIVASGSVVIKPYNVTNILYAIHRARKYLSNAPGSSLVNSCIYKLNDAALIIVKDKSVAEAISNEAILGAAESKRLSRLLLIVSVMLNALAEERPGQ